ncbi:MAG: ribokinase [Anaerolineae bacterium]|nr:ribokinase [Anaerolineae bacterium]
MRELQSPDFLVIGHITKDIVPGGYRVGGTATYAACTAQRLGWHAGILTRAEATLSLPEALVGVAIHRLPSDRTTTYENLYRNDVRQQFVRAIAPPITPADVPPTWQEPVIVLLGPVAGEVAPELAQAFPQARLAVTPQGWMRQWNGEGRVQPQRWASAERILPWADALILSEDDIGGDHDVLVEYVARVPVVVLTAGWRGATLYWDGRILDVAPRPAREVDPTGAGDVFAAAFLVRWHETGDPVAAARFANVVASFSVESPGLSAIPTRAQVEDYLP